MIQNSLKYCIIIYEFVLYDIFNFLEKKLEIVCKLRSGSLLVRDNEEVILYSPARPVSDQRNTNQPRPACTNTSTDSEDSSKQKYCKKSSRRNNTNNSKESTQPTKAKNLKKNPNAKKSIDPKKSDNTPKTQNNLKKANHPKETKNQKKTNNAKQSINRSDKTKQDNNSKKPNNPEKPGEQKATNKFPVVVLDRLSSVEIQKIQSDLTKKSTKNTLPIAKQTRQANRQSIELIPTNDEMKSLVESAVNRYLDALFADFRDMQIFPDGKLATNENTPFKDETILSLTSSDEDIRKAVELSLLEAKLRDRSNEFGESSRNMQGFDNIVQRFGGMRILDVDQQTDVPEPFALQKAQANDENTQPDAESTFDTQASIRAKDVKRDEHKDPSLVEQNQTGVAVAILKTANVNVVQKYVDEGKPVV